MNFTPLDKNGQVEGFCLVKTADKKTTAKGLLYLDMILSDSSGEINAKLWDYIEEMHGNFEAGEIVKIRGTVSPYNGVDQLRVERIRKAIDSDNVNISEFVPTAEYDSQKMYNELVNIAEGFENADLKKLVLKIYADYKEQLLFWPAAARMHHAMRGGLLYHTLSIVRLAQGVCKVYKQINKDLLLAGALLHDIAKIDEFELNAAGTVTSYSLEGNLVGHIVKGAIIIDRYAALLGLPKELTFMVEHMIVSHHGEPDFGAAMRPAFIEADILSTLDNLDAKMYEMSEAISKVKAGEFTGKQFALDNRKLYNTGLEEIEPKAELF